MEPAMLAHRSSTQRNTTPGRPPARVTSIPANSVRVWFWDIGDAVDLEDLQLLSPAEQARARKLRVPGKAAEFVTSRATVRTILADLLKTPVDAIEMGRRPCPDCGSPNQGPPLVLRPPNSLWISVSHTAGQGAFAVALHPVGIDIERIEHRAVGLLAPIVLTANENMFVGARTTANARVKAFHRCWTRKEAVLKAAGVGLAADLTSFDVQPSRRGDRPAPVTGTVPGYPARWCVQDLPVGPEWCGALAYPCDTMPTRSADPPTPP
ncbi:4'-phosphopantetheinyl transferase family protein [Streptomyces chartreusis]|uniref:4'-phosphopantetheinyl transferase family protein n=1 Tax=Streptomyces chartreusis TaxID=1969 RepID=UPI0037F41D09